MGLWLTCPTGIFYAKKGQQIWVSIFNEDDRNGYLVEGESGFSVALLTTAAP